MKYMSQGPMLVDVLMHKPLSNSRHYMDALLAFWPGLQVSKNSQILFFYKLFSDDTCRVKLSIYPVIHIVITMSGRAAGRPCFVSEQNLGNGQQDCFHTHIP